MPQNASWGAVTSLRKSHTILALSSECYMFCVTRSPPHRTTRAKREKRVQDKSTGNNDHSTVIPASCHRQPFSKDTLQFRSGNRPCHHYTSPAYKRVPSGHTRQTHTPNSCDKASTIRAASTCTNIHERRDCWRRVATISMGQRTAYSHSCCLFPCSQRDPQLNKTTKRQKTSAQQGSRLPAATYVARTSASAKTKPKEPTQPFY